MSQLEYVLSVKTIQDLQRRLMMSKEILKLIYDLGWEYDRMSSSGQETYDKLADLLEFDDE